MKQGDIVQLGRHRLMCGDAFNTEHVDALMRGEKPDMLYCDPPYGIAVDTKRRERGLKYAYARGSRRRDWESVIGDGIPFNASHITESFQNCNEQFWWGADYYRASLPEAGAWIVWDKRPNQTQDAMWGSAFELCWSRRCHKREIARVMWCGVCGMGGIDDRRYHPTQKPVALAEWFLERYSKPESLVVDLFAGSGSTLLACERMNRRCYTMEIDPHYCQVIIDRYQRLTHQPTLTWEKVNETTPLV